MRALIPCRPETALLLAEEISQNPDLPIAIRRGALNTVVCHGWGYISDGKLTDLCFRTALDSRARSKAEFYNIDLTWDAIRLALGGGELKEPLPVDSSYDHTMLLSLLHVLLSDYQIRGAEPRVEGILYMGILDPEKVRPSWKLEVKEFIADAPPADPTRRWAEKMIFELGWN